MNLNDMAGKYYYEIEMLTPEELAERRAMKLLERLHDRHAMATFVGGGDCPDPDHVSKPGEKCSFCGFIVPNDRLDSNRP